jgi:hypothetical protein
MQKHKFGIMCLGALFVGSELGPPEHEKHCIDVSCPGRTRTFSSHRIQKHKFSVTCPIYISVRFVGYAVNYGFVQSLNLGGSTGGTDEAYRSPHEEVVVRTWPGQCCESSLQEIGGEHVAMFYRFALIFTYTFFWVVDVNAGNLRG